MMKKEIELHELVKKAQAGQVDATLLLCERFVGLVRKLSYRYAFVVSDAEQEAWLAFWEAVCTYSESAGAMFPWYAQQKIRFALVNLGKKNKFLNNLDELSDTQPSGVDLLDEVQESFLWEKVKQSLNEKEYEVFWRTVTGDESKADIAVSLGITRQTVHNVFNKSVEKLKKSFGSAYNMI